MRNQRTKKKKVKKPKLVEPQPDYAKIAQIENVYLQRLAPGSTKKSNLPTIPRG